MSTKHTGYTPRPCVMCGHEIPEPERREKYTCSAACDDAIRARTGIKDVPTMRTGWEATATREKALGAR